MRILLFGLFLMASATAWAQQLLPIEHHQGDLALRIGPNAHEAWIGQSPQHTFEFTRQGFTPTHYLDLKWTDVRKINRAFETNLNDTNNKPCLCIESLNRWVLFTECFEPNSGTWLMSKTQDAFPLVMGKLAAFGTPKQRREFLQLLPCPPQDSVCRRLAMESLKELMAELQEKKRREKDAQAPELLGLYFELQTFMENGAGKTLMDFRRTSQAEAFFPEAKEIECLWNAYAQLAEQYYATQHWGPAVMLWSTLQRARPTDASIPGFIEKASRQY